VREQGISAATTNATVAFENLELVPCSTGRGEEKSTAVEATTREEKKRGKEEKKRGKEE